MSYEFAIFKNCRAFFDIRRMAMEKDRKNWTVLMEGAGLDENFMGALSPDYRFRAYQKKADRYSCLEKPVPEPWITVLGGYRDMIEEFVDNDQVDLEQWKQQGRFPLSAVDALGQEVLSFKPQTSEKEALRHIEHFQTKIDMVLFFLYEVDGRVILIIHVAPGCIPWYDWAMLSVKWVDGCAVFSDNLPVLPEVKRPYRTLFQAKFDEGEAEFFIVPSVDGGLGYFIRSPGVERGRFVKISSVGGYSFDDVARNKNFVMTNKIFPRIERSLGELRLFNR